MNPSLRRTPVGHLFGSLKFSPTRTCVEIELPPSVPFIISLLAFRPLQPSATKSFLHVESRSNWASCIVGPYRFKDLQTFLTNIPYFVRITIVRLQLEILRKSSSSVENWSKRYKSLLFRFNWFEELRTFDGWVFSFLESDFLKNLILYQNKRGQVHQENTTAQSYHHQWTVFTASMNLGRLILRGPVNQIKLGFFFIIEKITMKIFGNFESPRFR